MRAGNRDYGRVNDEVTWRDLPPIVWKHSLADDIAGARADLAVRTRVRKSKKRGPAATPWQVVDGDRALSFLAALAIAGLLRGDPQTVVSRTTGFSASAINMALLRARVRFGAKSTPHLVLVLERLGFIDEDLNVKERLI